MAVSGKFVADFADFQTAAAAAETKLVSFEMGANKVVSSIERLENSLSGRKLIEQATLAAQAVENIGGVSKLTEAELKQLGAQARAAADKMRAMGIDVPPGIQKIADATKEATAQTSKWQGALSSAAGAFGLAFSAGGLASFASTVLDTAGQLQDMSKQLGISTDAVQGFKFAAEQSGSTLDAVGTALTRMNVNLAEGSTSTVEGLRRAGLEFDKIRAMKPEDAFLAITDAIGKIEDPMTRSEVALQLFGKSAAELLPAIQEGFRKTADEADKMSQHTIEGLDRAEDAWEKLKNKVVVASGGIISQGLSAWAQLTSGAQGFATFVENTFKYGAAQAMVMADAMDTVKVATEKAAESAAKIPAPVQHATIDMEAMRAAMLKAEAARVIGPDVIPSVVALGKATVETTRNLSDLEAKLNAVDRLNASINSRLQALQDDLDQQQRERDARRSGGSATSITSLTRNIEGQITPLSERDASNVAALQSMIAKLSREIAEFKLPSAQTVFLPGAPNPQLAAAQQNANNIRQLEYLRTLLATAGTISAPVTVNMNGFIDPSTATKIADVVGAELVKRLKMGRQLGAA